jgi:Fe-S-cluster containining protein
MAGDETITGRIALDINGTPLEFELTVPAALVKPQRMLPVFQQMTNTFVEFGINAARSEDRSVSCKAGCGACCRQPVPISEVEAYQIAELVASMPEPRKSKVKGRFAEAVRHFEGVGWFEKMDRKAESARSLEPASAAKKLMPVALEYFKEGIPCPFLENESCSIHESRPLACREYLVTSPAENCSRPSAENIDKIEMAVRPSRVLNRVVHTGRFGVGTLTLIRALDLAERYSDEFPERSGESWMAEFFENLTGEAIGAEDRPGPRTP